MAESRRPASATPRPAQPPHSPGPRPPTAQPRGPPRRPWALGAAPRACAALGPRRAPRVTRPPPPQPPAAAAGASVPRTPPAGAPRRPRQALPQPPADPRTPALTRVPERSGFRFRRVLCVAPRGGGAGRRQEAGSAPAARRPALPDPQAGKVGAAPPPRRGPGACARRPAPHAASQRPATASPAPRASARLGPGGRPAAPATSARPALLGYPAVPPARCLSPSRAQLGCVLAASIPPPRHTSSSPGHASLSATPTTTSALRSSPMPLPQIWREKMETRGGRSFGRRSGEGRQVGPGTAMDAKGGRP